MPAFKAYPTFILVLCLALLAGCEAQPMPTPIAEAIPTVSPPEPILATPQLTLAEEPLKGVIPDIPDVFVVPHRQPKRALAAYLKTTPEQLDWVNPGLPDPVLPGTLIVIPPIYRTVQGETLADVAQKTGLPEEVLLTANPGRGTQEALADGTILAVPRLAIVPADTLLSATADVLQVDMEALLSANPELAGQEQIRAGSVLVVPPVRKEER
jgi:LysM repeat protein